MIGRIAVVTVVVAGGVAHAHAADALTPARLYASGQRAEALQALLGLSDTDRVAEMEALVALAREGGAASGSLGRAALMLHTERALQDRAQAAVVETNRRCGPFEHDGALLEVAALLVARQDSREFARRWYLAMAARSHQDLCVRDVRAWTRPGLRWFPRDPELLLAWGKAEEAAGSVGMTMNTARLDGPAIDHHAREVIEKPLRDARQALAQAVAVDPARLEARLRLGRVLWRQGDLPGARATLEHVAGAPSATPSQQYLAQLFLGRVHDDARRPADAERAYRAALAVDPAAQAPALGLVQMLVRSGDVGGARELLRATLAHTPRPEPRDAFLSYHVGAARSAEDALDELRAEMRP